jgi:hypothetical protein
MKTHHLQLERDDGSTYYKSINAKLILTEGDRQERRQVFLMRNGEVRLRGRLEDGRGGVRWQLLAVGDPRYDLGPRLSREAYELAMRRLGLEAVVTETG